METVDKLPEGSVVVGARQIAKAVKAGNVKKVFFAQNCPQWLIEKITAAGSAEAFQFAGDEKELGTRLGKAFPAAAAGYN